MFRKLLGLGQGRNGQRRRAPSPPATWRNHRRPIVEGLETRTAPTCAAFIIPPFPVGVGALTAICDGASDTVTLDHSTAGGGTTLVNGQGFFDAQFSSIQINTGGGNDTVNILRTVRPTTVISGALATVNLGNSTNGVRGITGAVEIFNPRSFSTININNSADAFDRNVLHDIGTDGLATIVGLAPAPIRYAVADLEALNVTLGSGSDLFSFANTDNQLTTLDTGAGTNTVFVQRTGGPLIITGGVGNDTVNVGTASLSLATISAAGTGLTLNGGGGTNTLNLDDFAAAATDYFLEPGTLTHNGTVRVRYNGFSNVVLNAGIRGDNIAVIAAPGTNTTINGNGGDDHFFLSTNPATYNGGAGSDTLWAPEGTNFWSISGPNSGNYNLIAPFTQAENLVGNLGDDTFLLGPAASLSGFLWDQGGNATLDYRLHTNGVYVNLATNAATAVAGGVYGIPNAVGGSGDDILVGDYLTNYLDGGRGRDLIIGGGIDWSSGQLGYQPDYLVGGEGEDIVIGGFTAYDADADALAAILAEWSQPTDYATRVANLSSGVGAPALNEGTVFYNYSFGNILLGLADLDLFFGDPSFDTSDWDPEAEGFVPVF